MLDSLCEELVSSPSFLLYREADDFVNLHPDFFHLEMCGARRNLLAASESEHINQMEKGSCVNSRKQTASSIHPFKQGPRVRVKLIMASDRLVKVKLTPSDRFGCEYTGDCDAHLEWLEAYSRRKPLRQLPELDLSTLTAFQREALRELARLPFGQTLSYGELAARTGHPRAARAVGSVCNKNPYPLFIPCHRVIAAGGTLGGFAYPKSMKQEMLAFEHVVI